ncbi:MAG: hypothetical protein ACXVDN_08440, partial [Ktedonobacteraceae bacterium]
MSSLVSMGQGLGLISSWLKYIVRGLGSQMWMGSGSINCRVFGVVLCQSSIGGGEQDIRKGYPYIYKGRMYIDRALGADLSTLLTSARDSANPSLPPRGRPQGSRTGQAPSAFIYARSIPEPTQPHPRTGASPVPT